MRGELHIYRPNESGELKLNEILEEGPDATAWRLDRVGHTTPMAWFHVPPDCEQCAFIIQEEGDENGRCIECYVAHQRSHPTPSDH